MQKEKIGTDEKTIERKRSDIHEQSDSQKSKRTSDECGNGDQFRKFVAYYCEKTQKNRKLSLQKC